MSRSGRALLASPQARPRLLVVAALLAAGSLGIVLLLVDAAGGCRHPGANVILVSVDTLRADHLGCYGYRRPTSPAIDRFARESVLFEWAIAQAPSTLPSHASIFTALIPSHHGALFSRRAPLPDRAPVLAGLMRELGYETASINDGGQIAAEWGLDRGFNLYESFGEPSTACRMRRTADRFLEWLDARRDSRPFFAFLHTYETHHPYVPEPRFLELFETGYDGSLPDLITKDLLVRVNARFATLSREDKDHIVAAYDAEIRSMDEGFAGLLAGLERRGRDDDTLIVLLSDHGEELGERSMIGWHSHALFDEQIHVPLVVRFPGGRPRGVRVGWQVRLIDVLPTILDAVGAGPPPDIDGASLLPIIARRERAHRPAVSQRDVQPPGGPVSLRADGWKYYRRTLLGQTLLFDLAADPGEATDLLAGEPQRAGAMSGRLDAILSSRPEASGSPPIPLRPEAERQLRALGYVE